MKVSLKAQIFISANIQAGNKKYCLVSVLAGGCNGLQYNMLFVDNLPNYEMIEISKGIYVDSLSLTYLEDCIIDLEDREGLKKVIIKNPAAKSSCSCGSSFSV